MTRNRGFTIALALACLALVAPAGAHAEPGALKILVTSNGGLTDIQPAIMALPGVATVDSFDTSTETPTRTNSPCTTWS